MKRAYADIPEGQIHYRIEGNGEPFLLLHMALASSDEYTRLMPFLSRNYRTIAMDYLGQGDSDQTPYPYQILDHVRSVISFMDSLGIKKANILGHHVGAKIGAELAITSPERVNKLVLSSFGYWQETSEDTAMSDPPNFTSPVEIKPDGSHLLEWWRRAAFWGDTPDIIEDSVLDYIKAGPRGEEMHWAARAYDSKLRLPLINCPTLVLSATRDPFYSVAEKVKRLVPKSKLTIIENGSVHISRVMPKEYAEAILSFLNAPG